MAFVMFLKGSYGLYEAFKCLIMNFPIGFFIRNRRSSSR